MTLVFSLADGNYEVERDENGLLVCVWRNGEVWPAGMRLVEYMGIFHAALDEIARLKEKYEPNTPKKEPLDDQ